MIYFRYLITAPFALWSWRKGFKFAKKIKKDPNAVSEETRYRFLKRRCHYLAWVYNIKIIPHGIENWVDGGCLLVSNHQEIYDPGLFFILNDFRYMAPLAFTVKQELKNHKFFSKFISLIDAIYIDRHNPRQALQALKKGCELIRVPRTVFLAPEGTRSHSKEVGDFHSSLLRIAQQTHSPIVTCAVVDAFKVNGMGWKPNYVHLVFGKTMRPQTFLNKPTTILGNNIRNIIIKNVETYQNIPYKESKRMYAAWKKSRRKKNKKSSY